MCDVCVVLQTIVVCHRNFLKKPILKKESKKINLKHFLNLPFYKAGKARDPNKSLLLWTHNLRH